METRTTLEAVEFHRPFRLRSFAGEMPAGRYVLELQEEKLEGLSFPAWRRTTMMLSLQGQLREHGRSSVLLTPAELTAILIADGETIS